MMSCSYLHVHLFISTVISSIKRLPVDLESYKNSDFLQRTTVLHVTVGIQNICNEKDSRGCCLNNF